MLEITLMIYIYILSLVKKHKMNQNIKDELKKSQIHIFREFLHAFFIECHK